MPVTNDIAEQCRRVIVASRISYLVRNGVPEKIAFQVGQFIGPDAKYALNWTKRSWFLIQRTLDGSQFTPYERQVHALFLMERAWKEVVEHPGSKKKFLQDPEFHYNWVKNQTMHLSLYHLVLPDPINALRSLRVLRAGLIILPSLL